MGVEATQGMQASHDNTWETSKVTYLHKCPRV
uniref:HVA22-like protein n=1 Tax=Rhizophora mucronata TaxID=61149 RepID=A0A2P2KW27_RHIMU